MTVVLSKGVEADKGVVQVPEAVCAVTSTGGSPENWNVSQRTQSTRQYHQVHFAFLLDSDIRAGIDIPADLQAGTSF